jgi:general secretion pathway protein K
MIVSVVAQNSRLDTRMCMADTEQLKCRWACKAAVESAIGMLNDDDKESDTLDDTWNVDTEDMTDVELDGCTLSFTITDEAGKLNINTAKKEQLLEIPGMRQEIADAIIDWRDRDDTPSPAGAEASYYLNLRPGYEIRNSVFRTVRELLMVKGINEELLYGPTAARIMQHGIDSETGSGTEYGSDQGWINYLTCYSYENNTDAQGDKRTNINKANEQELIKSLEITPGQAKWIVNNRKNNYKTIADILTEGQKAGSGGNADANAAEPIYMDTFEKIIDKITIDDRRRQTGKVNINTADRVVLSALLE